MLRFITVIILLVAFAAQSFNGAFLVFDYYFNTAEFAKNCENKARPQLHCNGQCLLMKKLKEAEKKEQRAPERKRELKADLGFSRSLLTRLPRPCNDISITYNNLLVGKPNVGFANRIFHPPSFC